MRTSLNSPQDYMRLKTHTPEVTRTPYCQEQRKWYLQDALIRLTITTGHKEVIAEAIWDPVDTTCVAPGSMGSSHFWGVSFQSHIVLGTIPQDYMRLNQAAGFLLCMSH